MRKLLKRLTILLLAIGLYAQCPLSAQAQTQASGSGARNTPVAQDTTDALIQRLINKADEHFKQGMLACKDRKQEQARDEFDKAVDVILDSGFDVRKYARLQNYYFELIERIHRLEMSSATPSQTTQILVTNNVAPSPTGLYAQDNSPIEVVTKDGRTAILKPDGTWEFKKVAPTPTSAGVNDKTVVPVDSLPVNYTGHDFAALYNGLQELSRRLEKSEFETTAQYEARIAEEKLKPILGNLILKDTFHVVFPEVKGIYNADAQTMEFFLPVTKAYVRNMVLGEKSTNSLYCLRWDDKETSGYNPHTILFDLTDFLALTKKNYMPQGSSIEVKLGVEEAKRLKNDTRAVLVIQLKYPYSIDCVIEKCFYVHLIDIYFFDLATGTILAKMSQTPGVNNSNLPAPIAGGVLNGKAVSLPKPAYPAIAHKSRASGTVSVQVMIDESGHVISARAISGHPLLQAAAVEAALGARFSPTLISGQPVKTTGVLNYNFVPQ